MEAWDGAGVSIAPLFFFSRPAGEVPQGFFWGAVFGVYEGFGLGVAEC